MKRNHNLFSFLTALWLIGCGGGAERTSSLDGPLAPDPLPTQVLQGRLKVGDLPVSHTEVQLRLNGQVLTSASSDELGSFQFDLQTPGLSKQVLGRGTQVVDVVAIIDGARYSSILQDGPEFVWVTELTTLVHDYMEDHPQATFEEADATVGRSLGCPAGEAVERLSDRDIFDPATFQQQADALGGDQAFFDLVGAGLGTQFYNFATPDPYKSLRLDGQDPHERVQPVQVKIGESDIAYGTTVGVLADNLTSAFGWVVYRLGSNIDPDLSQTVASMTSLQEAFQRLHSDLQPHLQGSEQYFTQDLDNIVPLLDRYTADLAAAVQSRPTPTDTPFSLPQSVLAYLAKNEYRDDFAADYASRFLNFVSVPSGEDTIQGRHRTLMRDLLGRSQPDPRLAYYDLRYNDLTDPLLNNLNFHLAGVRIAMDMLANSVHSHFLRAGQQANALAQEINFVRPTARLITNSFRKAQQLVPPKLVRDDIIALPPNFPAIAPGTPTLLLRGVWTWPLTPRNAPRQYLEAYKDFLCDTTGHPWQETGRQRRGRGEPPTPVTQGRWYVPDLNQMRVLDSIAATAGGGDALQGLIKLGVYPPGVTNPIYILYRGGFAGQDPFRDEENAYRGEIIQHVWQLSRPGRPGGHHTLIIHNSETPVPIAALFISSSLSEGSQEQFLSLLGTGTDVKPRIEVRFEGTRAVALATYQFANGQQCMLDVTDRVAWESDNPGSIEVSNLPGAHFPSGTLLTTRPGSANIKASFLVDGSKAGSPDGYITGSNQYSSQSEAQVRNLTITPRNVILTSAGASKFFCTGFAASTPADRPTHYALDVTPTTQWSLLDPNGLMVPANRATIANGVLTIFDTTLPAGIYTVEARLNGLLDQVKIRLQLQ